MRKNEKVWAEGFDFSVYAQTAEGTRLYGPDCEEMQKIRPQKEENFGMHNDRNFEIDKKITNFTKNSWNLSQFLV